MTIAPSTIISTPELWARHFLRIQDKNGAIIPFRYNHAQHSYMESRTARDLIVKARQLGFSTVIQGDFNRIVCTQPAHVLTLADTDENTAKLRRISKRYHDNWPDGIPRPLRGEDSAIIVTYPELNSSASIATAGARSAGRAGTYQALHGSEVAWWPRPEDTIAGALQAVPHDGWVVLESTPNGARGWFYDTVMESLDGGNNWRVHFYPWWWEPEYAIEPTEPLAYTAEEQYLVDMHGLIPAQINWRRGKVMELKHLFKQEYPEDIQECFLLSGLGYFGDISAALSGTSYEPVEDHRYVAGLDFGQVDYTVLSIGDCDTGQQVDLLRVHGLPWHDMLTRVLDRCELWGVSHLLLEHNSIGAPNMEFLSHWSGQRGMKMSIAKYTTSAKNKPALMSGLHSAIHTGALSLLDLPELRREFQAFQASQTPSGHWKYEAASGANDDIVIATALMYRTMARPSSGFIEL